MKNTDYNNEFDASVDAFIAAVNDDDTIAAKIFLRKRPELIMALSILTNSNTYKENGKIEAAFVLIGSILNEIKKLEDNVNNLANLIVDKI